MRPLFCAGGVLAVLVMAGLVAATAGPSSDDEITIKKVMQTLHKGKSSPLNTVKTALKGDSPDWTKVQKEAKVFATYARLCRKTIRRAVKKHRMKNWPRPMRWPAKPLSRPQKRRI